MRSVTPGSRVAGPSQSGQFRHRRWSGPIGGRPEGPGATAGQDRIPCVRAHDSHHVAFANVSERFRKGESELKSEADPMWMSVRDHTLPWCGGTCLRSHSSDSDRSSPGSRSSRVVSGSTSPKTRASRARSIRPFLPGVSPFLSPRAVSLPVSAPSTSSATAVTPPAGTVPG